MKLSSLPIGPYVPVLLGNAQMLDRRFRITSLYRSPASQMKLYNAWIRRGKTGLPAAPPGHSFHELGQAVDVARGVDPFKDDLLAYLGAWWQSNGLGWSPADPVHFQLQPIPVHAAGAASGERTLTRAPMPQGAADAPIQHPAVTRGLTDQQAPVFLGASRNVLADGLEGIAKDFGTKALAGAGAALLAGGGAAGVGGSLTAAASSLAALAPTAAIATVIGGLGAAAIDIFGGDVSDAFGGGDKMAASDAIWNSLSLADQRKLQIANRKAQAEGVGARKREAQLRAENPTL